MGEEMRAGDRVHFGALYMCDLNVRVAWVCRQLVCVDYSDAAWAIAVAPSAEPTAGLAGTVSLLSQ